MKFILITIAVLFAAVLAESDTYTDKYDSLDIDQIIGNKRLMGAYIKCVLERSKCTAEGRILKTHISDALQTGCQKCTPAQREGMRKVIHHLITEENEAWQQLVEKYDPKREYVHKYQQQLNSVLEDQSLDLSLNLKI